MKLHRIVPTALLAASLACAADSNSSQSIDAKAAFARLKTLAGEWQADTSMGKSHVIYEVIAGGATVLERESMAGMGDMLTAYNLDGNRLLLTHYCIAGNQPRMQALRYDAKSGELRFEFLDATNLASPQAGHMHNATLRFTDAGGLNAEWEWYEGGQRKTQEHFQYTRVR
jgi:hypothetical protein